MGWGVKHQDTYINQLEEWLNTHSVRLGLVPPRRFEVLNFAVAAYSPMQRLETLRDKVLAFHPDLVIYSATTLDIRLMEIHLCDMLRKNVDLKYDFLQRGGRPGGRRPRRPAASTAEGELINKDRLKQKLRPFYWGLYDKTLGAIAAECRVAGVPLVMVIIPRVGKADSPAPRAEPVARLKAIASHQGLTVFDLSDTFDPFDPAQARDRRLGRPSQRDRPSPLFLALARAGQGRIYRLLFAIGHDRQPTGAGQIGDTVRG